MGWFVDILWITANLFARNVLHLKISIFLTTTPIQTNWVLPVDILSGTLGNTRGVFQLFIWKHTVYPKKYAHGFVVLCFVVVMQSFIMKSHEVFIHIHQGCFAGTGAIVRLPQCQWSKPDGYGKIIQCITTTKHSKAKTVGIFLGIYCKSWPGRQNKCT